MKTLMDAMTWSNKRRTPAGVAMTMMMMMMVMVGLMPLPAHAQRGLKDIPDPDPEIERATFKLAEGFEVNLFAADPAIASPIQMNFDAAGRLWIASSSVYPQIEPGQKADDRILVLEDTDRDGKADKTTVFVDGLLIPTAVEPDVSPEGLAAYVANSTELLYLRDTDGDGIADQRRIMLSGFGTEDTHHILHTFRSGPDGCLYFNQSIYIHSHIETPRGVRRLNGGGIWRFRPNAMKLDVLVHGFVNTWGHQFDAWGQQFATDGAFGEGINYLFPGAHYVWSQTSKRLVAGLNPGQPKHCGLAVTSGRHLPDAWRGVMITNDFRGNRVNCFKLSDDGSGFASRQMPDLITSSHIAFRPVDVAMGPDGAIYIADWYNPIIQHGEVDFRDPRRDHTHGRIWRVTYKGRPLVESPVLVGASIEALLDALKAPEDWTRLHAKRQLAKRPADEVAAALAKWVEALDRSSPGFEHDRLEALWAHQSIDVVAPQLLAQVAKSPDGRARAAALRIIGDWHDRLPDATALLAAAVRDEHPRVRLEAVRALAKLQSLKAAELAMEALDQPVDRFLDYALWLTANDLKDQWLPALQAGQPLFGSDVRKIAFALESVGSPDVVKPLIGLVKSKDISDEQRRRLLQLAAALGGPDELAMVLDLALSDAAMPGRAAIVQSLVSGSQQRNIRPAGDLGRIVAALDSDDPELRAAVGRAAGQWKVEQARAKLTALAAAGDTSPPLRQAGIDGLAQLGGPASRQTLEQLCAADKPLDVRLMAAVALASLDVQAGAGRIVETLAAAPEDFDAGGAITPLLRHKQGPEALAKALQDRKLPPEVARSALRALRLSGRDAPQLAGALIVAGGLTETPRQLTPEQMQQMLADVASKGDPARGEVVYRRQDMACTTCHALGGAGGRVGPDLSSIGSSSQVDYLVEAILEPNKAVKEGFHSITVTTKDEDVITGILLRRSDTHLVVRDSGDLEVTIPVASIAKQDPGLSLMPAGLADTLTRGELLDLVAFLSHLGKQGPYAISHARLARRWRVLEASEPLSAKLRAASVALAASNDPQLVWSPAYSQTNGELPLDAIPRLRRFGDEQFGAARCELDVTTPGVIRLGFNSIDGLTLFLDGQQVPLSTQTDVPITPGPHTLTITIDFTRREVPLRCELLEGPGSKAQGQFATGK